MKKIKLIKVIISTILVLSVKLSFASPPLVWNISYIPDQHINRGSEFFNKIKKTLSKGDHACISGPSGIGKTYLATKFSEDNLSKFDIIYFINMQSNIEAQILEFFERLSEKGLYQSNDKLSVFEQFSDFTRTSNLNSLFIMDNAEEFQTESWMPPKNQTAGSVKFLWTSQSTFKKIDTISAPTPTNSNAYSFLSKNLPFLSMNDVITLQKTTYNYPLAIIQASSYLKNNPSTPVQDYFETVYDKEQKIKSLGNTILKSLEKAKIENEDAYRLMIFSSFVKSKNIPFKLIESYLENSRNIDHHAINEAINTLKKYSLLTISPQGKLGEFYDTHDFIQDTIIKSLSDDEFLQVNNTVIKTIRQSFMQGGKDIIIPAYSLALDHAEHALSKSLTSGVKTTDFFSTISDILEHNFTYKRNYKIGDIYINRFTPFFESKSCDTDNKVRYFLTTSRFYFRKGDKKSADAHLSLTMPLLKGNENDFESAIRAYIYAADNALERCDCESAEKHLNKVLDIVKRHGFAKHEKSSVYAYNKTLYHMSAADFYLSSGKLDEASDEITKGIETAHDFYLNIKQLNGAPATVMTPIYNVLFLSNALSKTENDFDGHSFYEKVEESFPEMHRFKANTLMAISNEDKNAGNLESALTHIDESINIYENWFSENNRETSLAFSIKGELLKDMGNDQEAELCFDKALAILTENEFRGANFYYHKALAGKISCAMKKHLFAESSRLIQKHKDIFWGQSQYSLTASLSDIFK